VGHPIPRIIARPVASKKTSKLPLFFFISYPPEKFLGNIHSLWDIISLISEKKQFFYKKYPDSR
jgi:hypothetical protein